jgi:hypothetical protein
MPEFTAWPCTRVLAAVLLLASPVARLSLVAATVDPGSLADRAGLHASAWDAGEGPVMRSENRITATSLASPVRVFRNQSGHTSREWSQRHPRAFGAVVGLVVGFGAGFVVGEALARARCGRRNVLWNLRRASLISA